MTRSSSLFLAAAAILASRTLGGQANARFPTEPVPPVILPYEPGGAEVGLHTRELDSRPFPAHRMIGNIYYVGQADYASYLITSDQGHILIDTTFDSSVPQIEKSISSLGFRVRDVKILLITHAHADHAEGAARFKALSGAQLMMMDGDAQVVETGAGGTMPPVTREATRRSSGKPCKTARRITWC